MYLILSPAKNLNENAAVPVSAFSMPCLLDQAEELMPVLKAMPPQALAQLMRISDKLALLNTERFFRWQTPFTPENAKQAVYLFNGDVYEGLDAHSLPEASVAYLQQHLGILSGLYGLLRPLDLIQPYRLEMGTKLANPRGADLYAFWGNHINRAVNEALAQQGDDAVLVNLASQEYFKSVQAARIHGKIITPIFKDGKNGQYKIISFYAKRARGLMTRFAAENSITDVHQLKAFDAEGYGYNEAMSNETEWVFIR
ncbi:peroxide stress protein YaaA [Stenoxybacter acetivorans]|uniref:peroxide stress protein YaaA n=1 Tax=Stenoxybacter acetivorans TaxID=422441 RepID=UPI000559BFEA|nr:peroxide stress protein YaaA [Stenoxybacter acetivorans]